MFWTAQIVNFFYLTTRTFVCVATESKMAAYMTYQNGAKACQYVNPNCLHRIGQIITDF